MMLRATLLALSLAVPNAASAGGPAAGAAPSSSPPPAASAAERRDDALIAWAPPDGALDTAQQWGKETFGGCSEGETEGWWLPTSVYVSLLWLRCSDSAVASDFLGATRWENGYAPAEAPPALGDGVEVVSTARDGSLLRTWTQGGVALSLLVTCQLDCRADSIPLARSVAATLPEPPDPRRAWEPLPGDPFAAWEAPPGWVLARATDPVAVAREGCPDGAVQDWLGPAGEKLEIWWVGCASRQFAFGFQRAWIGTSALADVTAAFGPGLEKVIERTDARTDDLQLVRTWVQGRQFANVTLSCPAGDVGACAATTARIARQLSATLPGSVAPDTGAADTLNRAGWLLLAGPLMLFLLLAAPPRIVHWVRTRGYRVDPTDDRFTSVSSLVRRVRAGRAVRRTAVTVAAIGTWFFALNWLLSTFGGQIWVLIPAFFGLFLLFPLYSLLLRLLWRRHPVIALARGRGVLSAPAVAGHLVRMSAAVLAGTSIVVFAVQAVLLLMDQSRLPFDVRSEIDAGLASPSPLVWLWSLVHRVAFELDQRGLALLLFVFVLLVPMTGAYLLDRLGRRLARRSLSALLSKDDRPYFVYLRGFDEDRLRIQEFAGRQGFLELFAPFGRPRFEEVLAHYLGLYGPVIAISPRRQRIADLGAAKISVGDDAWQQQIRAWLGEARAVVMSATPGEVRAGLEWEMMHVAERAEELRLLLVLAPWPRSELLRRWRGFLDASRDIEPFAELSRTPFPDGVHVLTWSAARGWRGYGATRRWDWTYAASIVTAVQAGDLGEGAPATRGRQTDTVTA